MVSVCMATHNGARFVHAQLQSILCQLAPDDEVVVSDDGSSDGTLDIIAELNDPRIRVVKMRHTRQYSHPVEYAAHNFENAIMHSRGDLIFLSDQDDVWLPGKVSVMTEALKHNVMVTSDCKVTDTDLNIVSESYFSHRKPRKGMIKNVIRCSYLGSCMAFQKELLNFVIPLPRKYTAHDIWIALIAEKFGPTEFISSPLMLYRRHDSATSTAGRESNNSLGFKILYRINLICALWVRITTQKHNLPPSNNRRDISEK